MLYSVVTVNFNNVEGLKKTFLSVFGQKNVPFEYIVIDGESSDGSKELIKENEHRITYWVSEKDNGVYHAMNKGVMSAKGTYVIFLNSGDCFVNENSLNLLANSNQNNDIIYGDLVLDQSGQIRIKRYPDILTFGYFINDTLPHPATLIKRDLLLSTPYNEKNKIVSDWEFFVSCICKNNVSYRHVPAEISVFDLSGMSSDTANQELIRIEKDEFLNSTFPLFMKEYEELQALRKRMENKSLLKMIKRFVINRLAFNN
ncbi:MAG: glycosyltransferase [Bacteroidetes bacterium]|nr:glycosyltransferase [Bacteroidota bacterium]